MLRFTKNASRILGNTNFQNIAYTLTGLVPYKYSYGPHLRSYTIIKIPRALRCAQFLVSLVLSKCLISVVTASLSIKLTDYCFGSFISEKFTRLILSIYVGAPYLYCCNLDNQNFFALSFGLHSGF